MQKRWDVSEIRALQFGTFRHIWETEAGGRRSIVALPVTAEDGGAMGRRGGEARMTPSLASIKLICFQSETDIFCHLKG